MKKSVLVLILGIVLLGAFGTEAKAQIPKEGTTSFTFTLSCAKKALPMGQEGYDCMGVIIGDTPEDLFHNASYRGSGALKEVSKTRFDDSGSAVITLPDGDQAFTTYKGTFYGATVGGFVLTFTGGTGKLTGIQGECNYDYVTTKGNLVLYPEEPSEGYAKIKKCKYKLP